MIKRRYYREEHGEGDAHSSSSSSSASEEEEERLESEDEDDDGDDGDCGEESLPQSGYESEESSRNEIDCDPSCVVKNEKEDCADERKDASTVGKKNEKGVVKAAGKLVPSIDSANPGNATTASHAGLSDRVLRFKSVFKCKLCPRIVCLSEETMKIHLNSKRHSRSEKLFKEGRLKLMLNGDGEVEEEAETHAERYARVMADAQNAINLTKKKGKGRQRQRKRLRKKDSLKDGAKKGKERTKGAPKHKKLKAGD